MARGSPDRARRAAPPPGRPPRSAAARLRCRGSRARCRSARRRCPRRWAITLCTTFVPPSTTNIGGSSADSSTLRDEYMRGPVSIPDTDKSVWRRSAAQICHTHENGCAIAELRPLRMFALWPRNPAPWRPIQTEVLQLRTTESTEREKSAPRASPFGIEGSPTLGPASTSDDRVDHASATGLTSESRSGLLLWITLRNPGRSPVSRARSGARPARNEVTVEMDASSSPSPWRLAASIPGLASVVVNSSATRTRNPATCPSSEMAWSATSSPVSCSARQTHPEGPFGVGIFYARTIPAYPFPRHAIMPGLRQTARVIREKDVRTVCCGPTSEWLPSHQGDSAALWSPERPDDRHL